MGQFTPWLNKIVLRRLRIVAALLLIVSLGTAISGSTVIAGKIGPGAPHTTSTGVALTSSTANAQPTMPGTMPGSGPRPATIAPHAISLIASETGMISWSIDGLGTLDGSCTIQVDKPTGATVRKAYMAAAGIGGSNYTP